MLTNWNGYFRMQLNIHKTLYLSAFYSGQETTNRNDDSIQLIFECDCDVSKMVVAMKNNSFQNTARRQMGPS